MKNNPLFSRLNHPFLGPILTTFIYWHWKAFITLIDVTQPYSARISSIEEYLAVMNTVYDFTWNVIVPVLIGSFYGVFVPILTEGLRKWVTNRSATLSSWVEHKFQHNNYQERFDRLITLNSELGKAKGRLSPSIASLDKCLEGLTSQIETTSLSRNELESLKVIIAQFTETDKVFKASLAKINEPYQFGDQGKKS
ncbi:hypothetical protein A9Q84_07780 [Halobacteriovorax marinus]|uniref:Uncharacterized protein n=1 Tax=Halobacteriovorax marinus TaxID=97084 RepID=A0A1Y5FB98_9BACT|nr:hypothetical protein A9Q84_07780 [Halobacteriovorax marinus]